MTQVTAALVRSRFAACLEARHLNLYSCETATVVSQEHPRLAFTVRYCPALVEKRREEHSCVLGEKRGEKHSCASEPKQNPFLPFDRNLHVSDLHPSQRYVLLFNKFCVIPEHLLVITREYIGQSAPLVAEDFEAVEEVLRGLEGSGAKAKPLAFYNSGPDAGASQSHRHFQVIAEEPLPIQAEFDSNPMVSGKSSRLPVFDAFRHACIRMDLSKASAFYYFQEVVAAARLQPAEAFNLLWTLDWMLLVPRRKEFADDGRDSLNAMAFAGLLLTRNRDFKLECVEPLKVLEQVTFVDGRE
jgi:ATP adenylyltransferase